MTGNVGAQTLGGDQGGDKGGDQGGQGGGTPAPNGDGGNDFATKYGLDNAAVTSLQSKGFIGTDGIDAGKLAKSYIEAERRMGGMVSLPEADKIADWNGWDKLGLPADPSGYDLNMDMPEGVEFDSALAERISKAAHKLKAPQHIVRGIAEEFANHIGESTQTQVNEMKEAQTRLQNELDTKFGADKDARLARAQAAFRTLTADFSTTGDATKDAELAASRANEMIGDAALVMLFDKIADVIGEDALIDGGNADPAPGTLEEANKRIKQLRSDPEFMKVYNDKSQPGHEAAVKKLTGLYQAKAGLK